VFSEEQIAHSYMFYQKCELQIL